ncbi:hypothetical protein FQZ97_1134840 [compost metagenome]
MAANWLKPLFRPPSMVLISSAKSLKRWVASSAVIGLSENELVSRASISAFSDLPLAAAASSTCARSSGGMRKANGVISRLIGYFPGMKLL